MSGEVTYVTVDAFDQQNEFTATARMEDRKRIFQLECMVETLLKKVEELENKPLVGLTDRESPEEKATRLRTELETRRYMKTADVKRLFGLNHHTQARRIMDTAADLFDDVIVEQSVGKRHWVVTLLKKSSVEHV